MPNRIQCYNMCITTYWINPQMWIFCECSLGRHFWQFLWHFSFSELCTIVFHHNCKKMALLTGRSSCKQDNCLFYLHGEWFISQEYRFGMLAFHSLEKGGVVEKSKAVTYITSHLKINIGTEGRTCCGWSDGSMVFDIVSCERWNMNVDSTFLWK